jgi:hypothetical protein
MDANRMLPWQGQRVSCQPRSTDMAAETKTWQSGGGRRIVLAFAFLILLPFYVSLGPMLYQRVSRGFVGDTLALTVLALVFTALMALVLQQLVHAVRTRVSLTETGIDATVPKVGRRGPFFLLGYETRSIPYGDVASVDLRTEVYGGSLLPVLLTSTRVVPKSGPPLVLGYTNANDHEPQLPYPEMGRDVAERAKVTVTDHGTVRRSVGARVVGMTSASDQATRLDETELNLLNAAHTRNVRVMVAGLALLVVGGIAIDFVTASRTSFAEMGAGLSNASKGATGNPVRTEPKKK